MVLIGFVLFAAAAALGIDVVAQNRFNVDIEVFGQGYTTTPAGVLVAGVVIGLVAALGLMLLRDGTRRRRALGRKAKLAQAEHDEHDGAHDDGEMIDVRDRLRDHVTVP